MLRHTLGLGQAAPAPPHRARASRPAAARLTGALLVAACLTMPPGCQTPQPRGDVGVNQPIPGVGELRVEEWRVLITHDPRAGVSLLIDDAPADSGDLRIGDRFTITDGSVLVEYQLLAIADGTARFRQRAWTALRSDPGIRTHQSVVSARSYPERHPPELTQ